MVINVVSPALRGVLSQLDSGEYPQAYEYLDALEDEEGQMTHTPYEAADTLLTLDLPNKFPDFLVNFITGLLDLEISAGNDDAMNDLGTMYYEGRRGCEQNFEKAMYYYNMAAERGNRVAQENLGYCYYYGRDGKPDYEKAFHYFALGAFDGHFISLYKIGDMYLQGLYVPKNEREAYYIFLRIIQTMPQDVEPRVAGPVFLRLGWMMLEGRGTDLDPKGALMCFHRAEAYLYDMVRSGDVMYRTSLRSAIKGQAKAREILEMVLPKDTWDFDE